MRVSNRIVNLLYESSTKDDKIWKLIDKYEAGEMSKEEVEKEVKRLNKGNKAEIEADLALIFKEYFAFANIKSNLPIIRILFSISFTIGTSKSVYCFKILSISIFSSIFKLFISLFSSNTAIGSIKTVEPLEEKS